MPRPGSGPSSGFNPRNAEDIFAEFFGSSPFGFGSSGGPGRSTRYQSDGAGMYGGFTGSDNVFRPYNEGKQMPKKPPPVETKLPCSLEELYSGSTRKMKISRTVDVNGYVQLSHSLFLVFLFFVRICSHLSSVIQADVSGYINSFNLSFGHFYSFQDIRILW